MAWFRIDDVWGTHPKVQACPGRARLLWVYGGLYCSQHLTDGAIPKTALPMLIAASDAARKSPGELVAAGLWVDDGDHYRMPDYLEYNPSRAKVLEERRKAAERQKRAREKAAKSHGESRRDIDRESQSPPTPPHPSAVDLPPPTSTSGDVPAPLLVHQAIQQAAGRITSRAQQAKDIPSPGGYKHTIAERLSSQHYARLVAECSDNPHRTVDELVAILDPDGADPFMGSDVSMLGEAPVDHSTPDCPCDGEHPWYWPDGPDGGALPCPGPPATEEAA